MGYRVNGYDVDMIWFTSLYKCFMFFSMSALSGKAGRGTGKTVSHAAVAVYAIFTFCIHFSLHTQPIITGHRKTCGNGCSFIV